MYKNKEIKFYILLLSQNQEYELISEQSGEGLCPYDPTHLSTATFVGE